MSNEFITQQITRTQTQITLLQDAIDFLYANPHKSYTLDTGQSKQTVSREELESLQRQVDILLGRLTALEARCNGGAIKINPCF